MDQATLAPSRAHAPDLDWSQVTETVRMLNLAVAQISLAMKEGEDSVGALTSAFTDMVAKVNDISRVADSIQNIATDEDGRGSILNNCAHIQGNIQQTIVAFQFYDRLAQRLDHVQDALGRLSGLVADKARLYNPEEWSHLQAAIRSRYTMQEEQDMFEALLAGATVEQALDQVRTKLHQGDIDDIELF